MRTYDSNDSLLIGPEEDDFAVFAHCDDIRAAAHDTGAGGVVTGVPMRFCPLFRNRYCLQLKEKKKEKNRSFTKPQVCYISSLSNKSARVLC